MEKQKTFTRIEQDVRHNYRNNLNLAESTEDVKKFFAYAIQDLIDRGLDGRVKVDFADISLAPQAPEGFTCSAALRENPEFRQSWGHSDLPSIIGRFAESASHRIKHLEDKHPDKTEAKMHQIPSHSGHRFSNPPPKKGR